MSGISIVCLTGERFRGIQKQLLGCLENNFVRSCCSGFEWVVYQGAVEHTVNLVAYQASGSPQGPGAQLRRASGIEYLMDCSIRNLDDSMCEFSYSIANHLHAACNGICCAVAERCILLRFGPRFPEVFKPIP